MRHVVMIDEAEYKLAVKNGAEALISKAYEPYNAEVNEIDGEYWLSFETDYPFGRNDWQE